MRTKQTTAQGAAQKCGCVSQGRPASEEFVGALAKHQCSHHSTSSYRALIGGECNADAKKETMRRHPARICLGSESRAPPWLVQPLHEVAELSYGLRARSNVCCTHPPSGTRACERRLGSAPVRAGRSVCIAEWLAENCASCDQDGHRDDPRAKLPSATSRARRDITAETISAIRVIANRNAGNRSERSSAMRILMQPRVDALVLRQVAAQSRNSLASAIKRIASIQFAASFGNSVST